MKKKTHEPESFAATRALAGELSRLRERPCLVLYDPNINARSAELVRDKLGTWKGEAIDVVLSGPGGCSCCAYAIARELHRRARRVAAYVPDGAMSAMTLIAISAGELVLGDHGALGPLDAQTSQKQRADVSVERSSLECFTALGELKDYSRTVYEETLQSLIENRKMCAQDACHAASELVGRITAPLFAQIDPAALGDSARHLELGRQYAERLLRRCRPDLPEGPRERLVHRLVWAYPAHGFLIDYEELCDLDFPPRRPEGEEADIVERFGKLFRDLPVDRWVCVFVEGEEAGCDLTTERCV